MLATQSFNKVVCYAMDRKLFAVHAVFHEVGTSQDSTGRNLSTESELLRRLELAEAKIAELESEKLSKVDLPQTADWQVGYERGFFLRSSDPQMYPYGLRINGRMQFRHTGFARDNTQWTDNSGITRPISNRNDF